MIELQNLFGGYGRKTSAEKMTAEEITTVLIVANSIKQKHKGRPPSGIVRELARCVSNGRFANDTGLTPDIASLINGTYEVDNETWAEVNKIYADNAVRVAGEFFMMAARTLNSHPSLKVYEDIAKIALTAANECMEIVERSAK